MLIALDVISSDKKLPVTVKLFPTVTSSGKPKVTLTSFPTLVTAVSISFAVPKNCKSSADKSTSCDPESPSTVNEVTILAVVTAVTKPLALTVTTGIALVLPNVPTLLLTDANVVLIVAVSPASWKVAEPVASPERATVTADDKPSAL